MDDTESIPSNAFCLFKLYKVAWLNLGRYLYILREFPGQPGGNCLH